jgi:hypothetical protein
MGIPFYGIERSRAQEATVRMNRPNLHFDYMVLGHFHQSAVLGNILMNGSLCGTTAYDHTKSRYSEPSQLAALIHPKHGLFNFLQIKPA